MVASTLELSLKKLNSVTFDSFCAENSGIISNLVRDNLMSESKIDSALRYAIFEETRNEYARIRNHQNRGLTIFVDSYVLNNNWFAYGLLCSAINPKKQGNLCFKENTIMSYIEQYATEDYPQVLREKLLNVTSNVPKQNLSLIEQISKQVFSSQFAH